MNEVTLSLTLFEVKAILTGLQELQAKVCNPITAKIHKQLQAISEEENAKQSAEPEAE